MTFNEIKSRAQSSSHTKKQYHEALWELVKLYEALQLKAHLLEESRNLFRRIATRRREQLAAIHNGEESAPEKPS